MAMPNSATEQRLYCYVDETGQETEGDFFLVTVVIAEQERDAIEQELEAIELSTGKKNLKWRKSAFDRRLAYIREVLSRPIFEDKIFFSHYEQTKAYVELTVYTTAKAINHCVHGEYRATVIVDGLTGSEVTRFGKELRQLNIKVKKVRGARDESSPLIRLADAFAGFLRDGIEEQEYAQELYREAQRRGVVKEV